MRPSCELLETSGLTDWGIVVQLSTLTEDGPTRGQSRHPAVMLFGPTAGVGVACRDAQPAALRSRRRFVLRNDSDTLVEGVEQNTRPIVISLRQHLVHDEGECEPLRRPPSV